MDECGGVDRSSVEISARVGSRLAVEPPRMKAFDQYDAQPSIVARSTRRRGPQNQPDEPQLPSGRPILRVGAGSLEPVALSDLAGLQ